MAKTRGDGDRQEPTLELPSLFGRSKKRRADAPEPSPLAAEPTDELAPAPTPEPDVEPAPVPEPSPEPDPQPDVEPAPVPESQPAPDTEPEPRRKAARSAPVVPATVATIVSGLVVGLVGTGLTALGLRGCEAMRGTDSCGGPGLGLLVVILVVMVVTGALLLKLMHVSEHRGTSFLGVGLMAVVVLLTLIEDLFSPWMFVAVPLITAAAFLVARWVTTRFVDIDEADVAHVDVR